MVRALWRSGVLRVTAAFALGGVGFALANLLLARTLTPAEYGVFTLVASILSVTTAVAPCGMDLVIARSGRPVDVPLWRRAIAPTLGISLLTTVGCWAAYGLAPPLLAVLLVGTAAGGITTIAAAHFQGGRRFGLAVPISQSSNAVMLLVAAVTLAAGWHGAVPPSLLLALGYVGSAYVGWHLSRRRPSGAASLGVPWHWTEALSLLGVNAAGLVFMQLERLILPGALSIAELATFGVASTLVASPFRILQSGVSYSVIPRLRQAPTARNRRRLLAKEAAVATAAMAGISLAIWLLTPLVVRWVLASKYHLSDALILAVLVSGTLKVASAFSVSIVSALADRRVLGYLTVIAWCAVGIGIIGGYVGAHWGLVGVVYGVAAGWLIRAGAAAFLAVPHLRSGTRAAEPAAIPS